jgi:hypothetical protein
VRECQPLRRIAFVVALAAAPVLVSGCGSQKDFANHPRPPANVTISAAITQGRIDLSPAKIGGGPITLSIANLSKRTVELKIEPAESGAGRAASGPITPQGTASVSLNVEPGSYKISATGGTRSTILAVGDQRKSAQNQLLQP